MRFFDGDDIGVGGKGQAEGVEDKEDGAEKERYSGQHHEAGGRAGPLLEPAQGPIADGDGGRPTLGAEPEGEAGGDDGNAQKAPAADGEPGQPLPALEGEEGGGQREKPEAGRKPLGQGQVLKELHGAPALWGSRGH